MRRVQAENGGEYCHFIGRTAIGRATVRVLGMNDSEQVELRLHLPESGTSA